MFLPFAEPLPQALWDSRYATSSDLRKVFEHTKGILFYGTPHWGGKDASLSDALIHAVEVLEHSASPRIVDNLKHDTMVLELMCEEFEMMIMRGQFDIHSFYETKGVSTLRPMSKMVRGLALS